MTSLHSLLLLLLLLLLLVHCSDPVLSSHLPRSSPRGVLLFEEKTRLGSIPPSCHNKCNQCHPCMAVQLPTTLPAAGHQERAQAAADHLPMAFYDYPSSSLTNNNNNKKKYSDYKPLGWKCHCRGHFYDP